MTDGAAERSPIKAVLDIRRGEWPLAMLMFGYFFLVITTFWILKSIKNTIFLEFYDAAGVDLFGWQLYAAQAELVAKLLNILVAYLAVVVFSALSNRLHRQQLTFVFGGFYAVTLVIYGLFLDDPGHGLVWTLYLYGDLWSTLMVATFFAFLNDSVKPEAAKRLYGLIVLGGVAGGAFGATFVRVWIERFASSTWMWIALGLTAVIAALAWAAGRIVDSGASPAAPDPEAAERQAAEQETEPSEPAKNPALEGGRLVFRSRYLLAIVGIVGLYEIVSTVLDFQFKAAGNYYLSEGEIGPYLTTVYSVTNITALVVQLFLTTTIMKNFRLGVALLVTPVVILTSSVGFLLFPILFFGGALSATDNAFNYSINQSARETLYTPTSRDEKYKAKAFIDMFLQRFAKGLAIGVSLVITTIFADFSTVRWLSLFTVAIVVLWIIAAKYAGARFRAIAHED